MGFSAELIERARVYLVRKMGQEPDKDTIDEFLSQLAQLGELFLKNVEKMENETNVLR